jgi:uncharacterized protein YjbI with pentapeptide repeats
VNVIAAAVFRQRLKLLNGTIEQEFEVQDDLSLHDLVTNGSSLAGGIMIAGCVFNGIKLVDRQSPRTSSSHQPAIVTVPIRFRKCVFKNPFHLQDIEFTRHVEFEECRFEKYVNCARSHFSGISFHDSAFNETVYFEATCFGPRRQEDESFTGTWAEERKVNADFSEATFLDGADFERTVFLGAVTFMKSLFYEATTFTSIRFLTPFNIGSGFQRSNQSPDGFSPVFSFTSVQIFGSVGFRKSASICQTNASPQNLPACTCWRDGVDSLRLFEGNLGGGRTEALELGKV